MGSGGTPKKLAGKNLLEIAFRAPAGTIVRRCILAFRLQCTNRRRMMNIDVCIDFRKATNCAISLFPMALMEAGFTPRLQGQAASSTFTITPALNQPIGVAYSPTVDKLLFSQPFYGKTNRQVIGVTDTGAASVFATLPDRVTSP